MAISSPIKPSPFLVPARLKELKAINVLSKKLYEHKRNRFLLEKRLYKLEQKSLEKRQLQERESSQESKKNKLSLKSSAKRVVRNAAVGLGSFLFDLLQFFIGYKIVEWVSKPENKKKVLAITKALKGIFDFLSWFVTGTIDNAFSGLHSVLFGETLLERFLGFFRLVVGLLGFRYLLRPGKLFKDLSFVIKNSGKILDVFNTFRKSGIKEGSEKLLQTLPKTAEIFKRGLARGITRGLLKVFGKGGVRLLAKIFGPAFRAVKNIILGPIKTFAKTTVKGIPIVGPLLDLGINLALGDPIDKAIVKAAGSALGMGLGGLIGSAFPGPGTIVGGALGGLLGDWAADKLYGWVKGLFTKKEENIPQLAVGGIVTQPTKAIIGEAGPEAVIPLPQLFSGSIFSAPLAVLASSLIGGINAVLFSMGAVGNVIKPFAQQLFAPFVRDFGIKRFTFSSNLGNTIIDAATLTTKANAKEGDDKKLNDVIGKNKKINLLNEKKSDKKSRYNNGNSVRELLADIFNNIINLDFSSPISLNSSAGAGGSGGAPPPVTPGAKGLLDFIAHYESGGDYNKIFGGKSIPGLTDKTIEQVVQIQKAHLAQGYESAAIGRYQMMLPDVYAVKAGLTLKDKFSPENQDKMAMVYLEEDGWSRYLSGKITADQFADNVAGTWAALPTGAGRSAHAGVGSNKSLVDRQRYIQQVVAAKEPAKMQTGGVVQTAGHPDTGPGYTIKGANDASGRPVVFSQAAASAFARMMKDSGGVVKPSDVASSKRSPTKNAAVGGASKSKHMYGIAMDIHGSSEKWIRKNGSNYGWIVNDYPGSHGGHFEFGGQGVQPSDVPTQNQESTTSDTGTPEVSWGEITKNLSDLYKGLTGTPKTNGAELQRNSMDMIQTQQIVATAYRPDTYIITPATTISNTTNVVGPLPQNTFTMNTSFAHLDSSSSYLQSRL